MKVYLWTCGEKIRSRNETKNYYWNSIWVFLNLMLGTCENFCDFLVLSKRMISRTVGAVLHCWGIGNFASDLRRLRLAHRSCSWWKLGAAGQRCSASEKKGREEQFFFDQFRHRQTKAHNCFFPELLLFYWIKSQFQLFVTETSNLSDKNMKDLLLEY